MERASGFGAKRFPLYPLRACGPDWPSDTLQALRTGSSLRTDQLRSIVNDGVVRENQSAARPLHTDVAGNVQLGLRGGRADADIPEVFENGCVADCRGVQKLRDEIRDAAAGTRISLARYQEWFSSAAYSSPKSTG